MASIINAATSGGLITTADTSGILQLQTAGTTAVTVDASQNVTFANSANLPNTFGFKNRIINGDMRIDQRNAGASVTPTTNQYTLDRWRALAGGANSKYSVQQNAGSVTPPAGFTNYFGVTSLSAYSVGASDYQGLVQKIEGYNVADLAWGTASAKTITLSFWVRSSLTGTFGGAIQNGNSDRSYPFNYTISSANTWTSISVTIAGDTTGTWFTDNSSGIQVNFGLGVGSTLSGTAGAWAATQYFSATGATSVVGTNGATFYITGVQLEKGSTATSFDVRDYGRELMLCQRYYQQFGSSAYPRIRGYGLASTETMATFPFATTMRAFPTGTLAGTWTATNCSAPACGGTDTFGYETRTTVTSTAMFQYYCNGTTGFATFDAEL